MPHPVVVVVVDSLVDAAEAAPCLLGDRRVVVPALVAAIRLVGHVVAQVVLGRVLVSDRKPVVVGSVQIHALLPGDLGCAAQVSESHLRVGLVSAALLALAKLVDVVADRTVAFAVQVVVHGPLEHLPIVQEHAHRQHRLDHGGVPVAVGGGVEVLDDRIEHICEQVLELLLVAVVPTCIRVADDLGGVDEVDPDHADQQLGVVAADRLERGRVGVQDLDRLVGMGLLAGDVPLDRVGVGRGSVPHQIRAADVRVVVGASHYVRRGLGLPVQLGNAVAAEFFPG